MHTIRRTSPQRRGAATLAAVLALCLAMSGCAGDDTPAGTAAPSVTSPAATPGSGSTATSSATSTPSATSTTSTSPTASASAAGFHSDCLTAAEAQRPVRLRSSAGTLAGVELGKGPRALVLTHQTGGSLCDWWPFARTLAQRGYRVLAIDFVGSGESTTSGTPAYDAADVATAVRHLRATGARRVGVVGLSIGGTVAVIAAERVKPRLDAAVSISGPAEYFGMNALPAAKRTTVPVLVVVAETDTGVDVPAVKALAAATRGPGSKLVVVPGSAHGKALLDAGTPGGPKVVTELTQFLTTTLGRA